MRTKFIFLSLIIALILGVTTTRLNAQKKHTRKEKLYLIETYDGVQITGKIISSNPEKLVIFNKEKGEIVIPTYQVKSKHELKAGEFSKKGAYIGEPLFPSRYFITTNAFPIGKGEKYFKMNLLGPEFQFGVNDHLGVGLMTSWLGTPIVLNVKYSLAIGDKATIAGGLLGVTGSWVSLKSYGAMGYGMLTLGNARRNLNVGLGYGWAKSYLYNDPISGNGSLVSIGGMYQITRKTVLIFDSYLFTGIGQDFGLTGVVLPGLRIEFKKSAFQFGFLGSLFEGKVYPVPLPVIEYIIKF